MKIIKITFIILGFICYIIIFGRHLSPEISYSPLWVSDLKSGGLSTANKDDIAIPFHLGGILGYVNNDGKTIFSENTLYGAAIDNKGFINYSRQNNVLVVRGIDGQFLHTVELCGYPFFSNGRRFIVTYDNNGISEIGKDGNILWQKTFGSSLSSISASGGLVFAGTVGGKILLINTSGEVVFSDSTNNSRINIVYGGSISGNGKYMVTVTGIDPQIISLWRKNGNSFHVIYTWSMDSEIRRHGITGFSNDGMYGYIEADKKLMLIGLKRNSIHSIEMTGRLQYINFPGDSGLIHMLGRDKNGYYLMIFETDTHPLFYTRLPGDAVMLEKDFNRIILGIGSKLIAYNVGPM